MKVLLSSSYWPNLQYFFYILNFDCLQIEQYENYAKQSYRNRTQILSSNGVLNLCIPIINKGNKQAFNTVEICYKDKWQINHWKAITSAYRNSPYFEYFEEDIKIFYFNEFGFLLDYNLKQIETILRILKQKKQILLSTSYIKGYENYIDLRNKIHPKIDFNFDEIIIKTIQQPYYQTFENKFNFKPNLSILDLLFNLGLDAYKYLKKN